MYIKQNCNSYGQFLRSRERFIHVSATIVPPSKITNPKTRVVTIIPAHVKRPGNTYVKKVG